MSEERATAALDEPGITTRSGVTARSPQFGSLRPWNVIADALTRRTISIGAGGHDVNACAAATDVMSAPSPTSPHHGHTTTREAAHHTTALAPVGSVAFVGSPPDLTPCK